MTTFRFSKTALQAVPLPESGRRDTHYDTDVPKLALRVTAAGARTFYVVRRTGGSIAWVKLGSFPDMTVEQARASALEVLSGFASGADPAAARRAFKAEPTLTEFFAEYGKRHGEKKLSWAADQQRFRDYLQGPMGGRKLSEIDRAMVARVLSDATRAGKAVATVRNIRALASGVFGKAVEWGCLQANPAQGVRVSGQKVSRDRFLQADELSRFFASVAEENPLARDFILLALLTGARRANLRAMQWDEVDLAAGVWRIPATKNGTPQNVALSPEAVMVLQARKEAAEASPFVFPGSGESGHLMDPKKGVMRVMERAGIPYGRDVPNGVTLHDLRRTLGSWQARTGASFAIIGKSLNHKSLQATAIYARLDLDPVRQSVNTATAAMLEAAGLKEPADVVKLPAKRSAA